MKKTSLTLFITFVLFLLFTGCSSTRIENNFSLFRKDGKYGIISENRDVVLKPVYKFISFGSNAIICSRDNSKEIYTNSLKLIYSSGEKWVNLIFYTENEILIRESMTGKTKLLNVKNGILTDYTPNKNFTDEYGYRDSVGLVWETNKKEALYSIVNKKGKVLLTDIEQAHSVFSDGMMAVIMNDGRSGFVNTKGEMVIESTFYISSDDFGPRKYPIIQYLFKNNYALVKNSEKKWIQYDINGNVKTLPDNIELLDFCYESGLVPVRNIQTKKSGYMNPDFEIMIPIEFTEASAFFGKYAIVTYKNEEGVIDSEGNFYSSESIVNGSSKKSLKENF